MVELWERQPNERLQTYLYKEIYITQIKKANKKLEDVIIYIQQLPSEIQDDTCLYRYNGNLIEVPTPKKLEDYSRRYCWFQADEDYTNHLVELDNKRREQEFHQKTDDMDQLLCTMFDITKESADELKTSAYKTSTKIQLVYTLSRSIDLLNKNLRLNHGRPTGITKSDVDLDAEVNYGNVDDLIEAFDASKKEWEKHKEK